MWITASLVGIVVFELSMIWFVAGGWAALVASSVVPVLWCGAWRRRCRPDGAGKIPTAPAV